MVILVAGTILRSYQRPKCSRVTTKTKKVPRNGANRIPCLAKTEMSFDYSYHRQECLLGYDMDDQDVPKLQLALLHADVGESRQTSDPHNYKTLWITSCPDLHWLNRNENVATLPQTSNNAQLQVFWNNCSVVKLLNSMWIAPHR